MLLDNHKQLLPFAADKIKTLAVVGPNADNGPNMQGVDCHGVPPFLITPRMAFSNMSGVVVSYAQGCAIGGNDTSGFADAVAAVERSDAVVLVGGLDPSIECVPCACACACESVGQRRELRMCVCVRVFMHMHE